MSNDTLASGGKTWSIPTDTPAATSSKSQSINAEYFIFIALLGLISAMSIMGMFIMLISLTGWNPVDIIMPSLATDSTVSPSEGYSATGAPNSLFVVVIALLLFGANKVILCLQLWHKKKLRITLIVLFTLSSFGAGSVAEASMSFNKSETTATQWMQERYGFNADNSERSQVLTDGEYLYDSGTKTIAKVQKQNNKFYLYDTDGNELPTK